jgi:hypothetical protein
LLGFAACAVASTLWGCGFFFGKIALAEMGVGSMVLYRFLFAALALLPLVATHRPGLNAREWRMLLFASFLGVPLQFLIQFRGLQLTTVSHASLMVGTMPVILAVGATLFAHERLHGLGWGALAVSTAGAALIALGHTHHAAGGDPTVAWDLLDFAEQGIDAETFADRGDGVWAGGGDGDADGVCAGGVWDAAGAWGVGEGVAGAGGERGAVHGDDDAAVELGDDAGAGVAGRRVAEHGAAGGVAAGSAGAGREAGGAGVCGRRDDRDCGDYADDARASCGNAHRSLRVHESVSVLGDGEVASQIRWEILL